VPYRRRHAAGGTLSPPWRLGVIRGIELGERRDFQAALQALKVERHELFSSWP
jgi:hypothetical protein